MENSSPNSWPQIDSPPVPSPRGSPHCCCDEERRVLVEDRNRRGGWEGKREGGKEKGGGKDKKRDRLYLYHEFTENAVKDGVIVVSVFRMRDKIFDRFRRRLGEKSNMNITKSGMQYRARARLGRLRLYRLLLSISVPRFFILYITRRFDYVFLVGEYVEADLARAGADEQWVSLLGFF